MDNSAFNLPRRTPLLTLARRRYAVLYTCFAIAVAVLVARSSYLQIVQGGSYRKAAEQNRVAALTVAAPRGILFDSRGKQLVENIASTNVMINPITLAAPEFEGSLLETLPGLLRISPTQVRDAIVAARATSRRTKLVNGVDHDTVLAVEQALSNLPGVELVTTLTRNYMVRDTAAHVIGYASTVSTEDLVENPDLKATDVVGKTGLERQYDRILRGRDGLALAEVNVAGVPLKQLSREEPQAGSDLNLTLDSELQAYIMDLLRRRDEEKSPNGPPTRGAVVALDPRSGAVRALVSYPTFDPNAFSQPSITLQTQSIISDPNQPLFNRALDGLYAPGSTIKPLLAAAELQEGIITPTTTIVSTGGLSVGPWQFPDWKIGGHGVTNVTKALAESVNTFFYTFTGGTDTVSGLGIERASYYLRQFGWGEPVGIDLPGTTSGFIPTPDWKENTKNESWYIGDTYHLAIGQGDVLTTPLHVAQSTAAIANDGTVVKPFLVRSTVTPTGEIQETQRQGKKMDIKPQYLNTVRAGMREAVHGGSARQLNSLPLALAGKTGTAQVGGTDRTHAWFTSFGPVEDPKLVVTVLLEEGGEGDKDAVPLAKEIWQWWVDQRGVDDNR